MKTPSKQKTACLIHLIASLVLSLFCLPSYSQFSDVEPNNTFETANPMFGGTEQSGILGTSDYVDYFFSPQPVNGTLIVHLKATNLESHTSHFDFTIYDQTKVYGPIAHPNLSSTTNTLDSTFSISGLSLSALYIAVSSNGAKFSYSFSFQVINIPLYNDIEPNNDFLHAIFFKPNEIKEGQINYINNGYNSGIGGIGYNRDNYDYYKLISPVNGTLKLHLSITCNEIYTHPELVIYDKNKRFVAQVPNKEVTYNNTATYTLSTTCQTNDTFYVQLSSYNGGIGIFNGASTYQLSYDGSNLPISINLVNPNPDLINNNGVISVNTSQIDTTQTVTAAATDGVTKLLLVTNSSFPLIFSVPNSDGSLSALSDQKTLTKQITIEPDDNRKVVAVYTVPDGYGITNPVDGRSATVTIANASNAGNYTTASIKLVTPPVVMVHGMWSDPSIWVRNGFTSFLAGSGIRDVYLADYSQASSVTFDPYNFASFPPRMAVQIQIDKALKDYQDKKIAVTQVDVVGHSLGGLMTRSLSQQSSFLEQRNYYKGFVHKLITLGTPHRGSPFGPELYKYKDALNYFHVPGTDVTVPYPLFLIMQFLGMPIGSCHQDFGITSQGISDLSTTLPYRTFAITANHEGDGIIPRDLPGYAGIEALSLFAFHKPFEEVMESRCNTGVLPNDLIVPYKSQTGYINSTQTFYGTCHSIPGLLTETNNPLIQLKVSKLLLSDDTTEFSVGFPAPSSFPLENCDNASELTGENQPVKKKESANNLAENLQATGKEYVQISAPARGSVYHQSIDTVITVEYEPLGGSVPTNALLVIQDIGWYKLPTTPPYSTNILLPKNVNTGSLHMALMVTDTTGVNLVDTSHITFLPSGILNSITIQPTSLLFDSLNRQIKMMIQEEYAGVYGTYLSNISDTADGITYVTQKGNSIISITTDGTITAVSAGIDTLTVQIGDSTFRVPVRVDSNFLTRTLYPNVIDFADIPDKTESDTPFALDATVTSGNNVSFTLISGPAEIINGVVYIKGSGTVTIQATSGGTVYFDSAASVTKTFFISGALPLQLLSFTGSLISNDVLLNWTTSNEVNTFSFIVERSTDGIHFTEIGIVNTTGNSSDKGNYYFKDPSVKILSSSPIYYRLKQIDKDGKQTLSITILITVSNEKKIVVYPNPAKRVITLLLSQALESDSYLKLYDMTGKEIMNRKLTNALSQQIYLPVVSVDTYKIVIWNNGKIVHQQLLFVSM